MNNIPQDTLQAVADAAFLAGIGEYTDDEIKTAWTGTVLWHGEARSFEDRLRAFLAALPRRESPALAEAIARAEKAEKELAALKSAQLGILRPIAEMPETVPDGCMVFFRWRDDFGSWVTGTCEPTNGFFAILRLPAAEATPPAEPEPAAQVPLGPEDCPPGSAFRFAEKHWYNALYVSCEVVCLISGDSVTWKDWNKLQDDGWQINTSIPDTGRWDANAWRPCSKPGK